MFEIDNKNYIKEFSYYIEKDILNLKNFFLNKKEYLKKYKYNSTMFYIDQTLTTFILKNNINKIIFPKFNNFILVIKNEIKNLTKTNFLELFFSQKKFNKLNIIFVGPYNSIINIKKLINNINNKKINYLFLNLGHKNLENKIVLNIDNFNVIKKINLENIYKIEGRFKNKYYNSITLTNISNIQKNIFDNIKQINYLIIENYNLYNYDKKINENYLNFLKNQNIKIKKLKLYFSYDSPVFDIELKDLLKLKKLESILIKEIKTKDKDKKIEVKNLKKFTSIGNNFNKLYIENCKKVEIYDDKTETLKLKNIKNAVINEANIKETCIDNISTIVLFDNSHNEVKISNSKRIQVINSLFKNMNIKNGFNIELTFNDEMLYIDDYIKGIKNTINKIKLENINKLKINSQTHEILNKIFIKKVNTLEIDFKYIDEIEELIKFFNFIFKNKYLFKSINLIVENNKYNYNYTNMNNKIIDLLKKIKFFFKRNQLDKVQEILKKEILRNIYILLKNEKIYTDIETLIGKEKFEKFLKKQKKIISSFI